MRRDSEPGLARIAEEVAGAAGLLPWRLERGEYYLPGAAVSDSYRDGNMNATLLAADDFVMGLFLLVPGVDYLDHRHAAPEFYLNLTGPSSWRFNFGDWEVHSSGSVLWNDPGRIHALRTNDDPWLSVFAWLSDVDKPCEIVRDPGGV
jgi:quercetin dioxygenase-like cupin family protein